MTKHHKSVKQFQEFSAQFLRLIGKQNISATFNNCDQQVVKCSQFEGTKHWTKSNIVEEKFFR